MSDILVAFPKLEVAQNIKRILGQSGYTVTGVCTTGAAVLSAAQQMESGIVICGFRLVDMVYTEIYEYLPQEFQMLLIASAANVMRREVDNVICLSMPLKVHELLQTVEMMEYTIGRRRRMARRQPKQRTKEEQLAIEQAKRLLMDRNSFSEEEAHRYIQKRSMDNGTDLAETAQMILSLMGDG